MTCSDCVLNVRVGKRLQDIAHIVKYCARCVIKGAWWLDDAANAKTSGGCVQDLLTQAAAARRRARADRRCIRSRSQLRDALAAEIQATGDLSRVTVTAVTERAGLTRRTFYSHFRDIPDLVDAVEREALDDIRGLVENISSSHLDELTAALASLEAAPGTVELLSYFRDNASHLTALLSKGGDPAFVEKIKDVCRETVVSRALDGIDSRALGPFFDYYLAFAVSAEAGVLTRWLTGGMREDVRTMALIMTSLMFVRPGDLYGKSIDFNVPAYALALMQLKNNAERGGASAEEKEPIHD